MKKQWRVLFLAAAAAVVMSTGCGNSASTQTTAPPWPVCLPIAPVSP